MTILSNILAPSPLITESGTQTLLNKTITSPTLNGTTTVSSGTANGVAYLNASKALTTGTALTFDGTALTTSGNGVLNKLTGSGSAFTDYQISGVSQARVGTQSFTAGDLSFLTLTNAPIIFAINSTQQMRLTSTGLGIGTSSPGFKLDVGGENGTNIALRSTGTGSAVFRAYVNGAESGTHGFLNGGGQYFEVGGSEQMRLTSTGLGIGTSVPQYRLDIQGASGVGLRILETSTGNSNRLVITQEGGISTYNATYGNGSTNGHAFQVANSEKVRITSAGYIGIGTTNPLQQLVISNGGAEGLEISPTAVASGSALVSYNRSGAAYTQLTAIALRHVWQNSGTEAMRLDSSGNFGLGVTPSAWAALKPLEIGYIGNAFSGYINDVGIYATSNAYYNGGWKYAASSKLATRYSAEAGVHSWSYAPSGTAGNAISFTQAMTLDASGNLTIATTSIDPTQLGIRFLSSATVPQISVAVSATSNNYLLYNTTAAAYRFFVTSAGVINATTTTITGISDQRLKENIVDLDDGLSAVMDLKPRKFDWKAGKGKDIKGDRGFIAQEFETVFPDMIQEWVDPAPEGEEPYKAVNANLIPVLVKAIQEQQALITDLQTRLTALEGN